MLDYIQNTGVWFLCWFNAGGFWSGVELIQEYLKTHLEAWAYSKVK